MYSPELTILPTVTLEANRIPKDERGEEHLRWVWYSFPETQLDHEAERNERTHKLLADHPEIGDFLFFTPQMSNFWSPRA